MKNLGFYNGKYDEMENMSIPMSDRVCWFGDGVYDATTGTISWKLGYAGMEFYVIMNKNR